MTTRVTSGDAVVGQPRPRDEGAVLIFALLVISVSAMLVIPLMTYSLTVSRAGRVTHDKSIRIEAAKGGLRTALSDPLALYRTCGYTDAANPGAGLNNPITLGALTLGSVNVSTTCSLLDYTRSNAGSVAGRYGITHLAVGSTAPAELAFDEKIYPGSGQADASAWIADSSIDPAADRIWMPRLPIHGLNKRSVTGYQMPASFPACTVYFPGTYQDDLVITGASPVYFASGIYYFEKTVRISGSASVVVGGGASVGCTTDQEAAFYAVGAPPTHNISGLGATVVFGEVGGLVVDTATTGTGARLVFNYRYVAPDDKGTAPSSGVSIMTVNGQLAAGVASALDLPGELYVPLSLVGADPPSAALAQEYKPSTLVPPVATQTPVVQINLTNDQTTTVDIPGYVSVPQGLVSIHVQPGASAGNSVALSGGVAASSIEVMGVTPKWVLGLDSPVVQQTFRLVSTTNGMPVVKSIAIIQVNQNGAYAVNSWSVQ